MLRFHPMDEACARAVLAWHYEAPYDIYDTPQEGIESSVATLLTPEYAYYSLRDEAEEIVAYCCCGLDARVPGGDYSQEALDIGLGIRPDLTGQGRGMTFVQAVLEFATQTFDPPAFRVTVAGFNQRAQLVWEKAGFATAQTFQRRTDGMEFVILSTAVPI